MHIDPVMQYLLAFGVPLMCFIAGFLVAAIPVFLLETAFEPRKLSWLDGVEGRLAMFASGLFAGAAITAIFLAGADLMRGPFLAAGLIALFLVFGLSRRLAASFRDSEGWLDSGAAGHSASEQAGKSAELFSLAGARNTPSG